MFKGVRAATVAGGVLAVTAVLPTSASHAAWSSESYSPCVNVAGGNFYATAQARTERGKTASATHVELLTYGYGKTFDCVQGSQRGVDKITIKTKWSVSGSSLNCEVSLSGSASGPSGGVSCNANKSDVSAEDVYTCTNTSSCTAGYTPAIFEATGGGSINKITVYVTVSISGNSGSGATTTSVTAFPF